MKRDVTFGLSIARVFLVLWIPAVMFFLVNFALLALKQCCNRGHLCGLGSLLRLDAETNFPTLYSVLLWLIPAAITLVIGFAQRLQRTASSWPWFLLVFICMAAGTDEFVSLHEQTWPWLLKVPGWQH